MPEGLEGLIDLALDLRWSWNHAADKVWREIAPDLWEHTGNPWLILQIVANRRLQELAADASFRNMVNASVEEHRKAIDSAGWFQQAYGNDPFNTAYFSMEFGLSEALPIYSGGLGILAGDYLKTASDLGVPVTGVGLLYQQGYFRQVIESGGDQAEFYPYNDPSQLPVVPVRDKDGEWLRVELEFPGRKLWLRCWEVVVGKRMLYLLDTNDPMNDPPDRGITSELYGGSPELRIQQEIVLGIGGWRLLKAAGFHPEICHLNEGHAAFAVLERARSFMDEHQVSFQTAMAATRAGNVFTTHTPVEAGFDRFPRELIARYFTEYAPQIGITVDDIMAMGRQNPNDSLEPLNMAYLATRGSNIVNAVSRLHGEVSRRIFQPLYPRWPRNEVPVTHITNGVHMPSWDSASSDICWTNACGRERWLSTMDNIENDFKKVPDEELWGLRMTQTRQLLSFVQDRLKRQLRSTSPSADIINQCGQQFDPNVLTVGFARRFTGYKRPNLLLHDPERLERIINNPKQPVQLVIAGKAHPLDPEGKDMVREWWQYSMEPNLRGRIVFLSDYDMEVAEEIVQGVDLWINTPRRPWEACGTSGMKVLVNAGLNLSELDGWWAEAYRPEVGWAIGDGQEHDADPNWDAHEADELYHLLETEVIPSFYDRDPAGIPRRWVSKIRESMAELTPRFSANRMVREYVDILYHPSVQNYRKRMADNAANAEQLCRWRDSLESWHKLRFGNLDIQTQDDSHFITVSVYLDDVDPQAIQVQLYADPLDSAEPEIHVMELTESIPGTVNGYSYQVRIPARRPIAHYTARIVPFFDGAKIPLEANWITWYES